MQTTSLLPWSCWSRVCAELTFLIDFYLLSAIIIFIIYWFCTYRIACIDVCVIFRLLCGFLTMLSPCVCNLTHLFSIVALSGKKFDLRVYALVTSYNPLTIYLHRSGFARFTTQRFTMNLENITDTCECSISIIYTYIYMCP